MSKIRIGLAGLGRLGKEYAQNIQYKSPNAKLIAVCSLVKDELEYAKGQLGVEFCFPSFEEMVEKSNLDAVAILTPTKYHAQQIIFSLKNGLHVFSEKPLAISLEDCLKAEKEANKHPDLISCVGFVRRYDESYMDAKEAIEKNKIGDPFFVRSQTVDKDTWAPFQVDYVKSGGGIFHDFNVHDADLARWFVGSEVKKVWALGGAYRFKEFGDLNDADNTFAFCEFENGKMALLGASRTASYGHDTYTEIIGTVGKLTVGYPPFKNRLQISDKNGFRHECNETFYDRFKDAFLTQIHDFINSILNKKQNQCTLSNATKATLITSAMTKSFKTKKIIELKDLI
ncbi:Gfo/Idh/MocA family oxidoreductase [Bacteroidota bacterium]|nr:Gfo/Idh/MocA family oxidoreductase [Bacteroidota bacterium]